MRNRSFDQAELQWLARFLRHLLEYGFRQLYKGFLKIILLLKQLSSFTSYWDIWLACCAVPFQLCQRKLIFLTMLIYKHCEWQISALLGGQLLMTSFMLICIIITSQLYWVNVSISPHDDWSMACSNHSTGPIKFKWDWSITTKYRSILEGDAPAVVSARFVALGYLINVSRLNRDDSMEFFIN